MKVDQVERVEPLSTDSGGGGSVVGTHPVSSAAEGGNTIVEAAKTLGNRS